VMLFEKISMILKSSIRCIHKTNVDNRVEKYQHDVSCWS